MQYLEKMNFSDSCLTSLTEQECYEMNGGSIWGEVAYVAGATIKCMVLFCTTASEYQASLPPNLKK